MRCKDVEKIRKAYNLALRWFLKKSFPFWERLGFHITPIHYESPILDTHSIKDDLRSKYTELIGIDINEETMLNLLHIFSSKFKDEYERFPRTKTSIPYRYYVNNGAIESVDGEIYYFMIRCLIPKRIIEIGVGYSTYLAAQAILKNKEECKIYTELNVIKPYPKGILIKSFPGLSKLIVAKVQDVDLYEFKKLKENDILFINSRHVLR